MTATKPRFLVRLTSLAVAVAAVPTRAADPPPVGAEECIAVLTVSMAVGSFGRDSKWAVYAPPPGWYIRSHHVSVSNRTGYVTYTVSTVPTGWKWESDEQAASSGRGSGSLGLAIPSVVPVGGQAAAARDAAVRDRHANASSHHMLFVEVTAQGAGLLRGGGGADLTVYADMVYLGR